MKARLIGSLLCLLPGLAWAQAEVEEHRVTVSSQVVEVMACGETYSLLRAEIEEPGYTLAYREIEGGNGLTFSLPDEVIALDRVRNAKRITVEAADYATLWLKYPLLPKDLPLSDNEAVWDAFCRMLGDQDQSDRSLAPSSMQSGLVEIHRSQAGQAIRPLFRVAHETKALPVLSAPATSMLRNGPAPLVHLVLHSAAYAPEATQLAQLRSSQGIPSLAVDLASLPGMRASDPLPASCEGDYRKECFFYPDEDSLTGMQADLVPGLFGMAPRQVHIDCKPQDAESATDMQAERAAPSPGSVGSFEPICQGPTTVRIPDRAGLIRAFLRQTKAVHPELRYVVLLGEPKDIPPRFTTRKEYADGGVTRAFTMPTDLYYAEVNTPWLASDSVNYTNDWPSILPCGNFVCSESNTDWDTSHFAWAVKYPFTRTFVVPAFSYPQEKLAQVLSVGRINAKPGMHNMMYDSFTVQNVPDPNPPVYTKDPSILAFVDKLTRWDAWPQEVRPEKMMVVSADGVYAKNHLTSFESIFGPFVFIAEGFGTGFVTDDNRPSDWDANECWSLADDDWHLMTNAYGYQYQKGKCKPRDDRYASETWLNMRLPAPDEVSRHIQMNGFHTLLLTGHGGFSGIGFNTHCPVSGSCDWNGSVSWISEPQWIVWNQLWKERTLPNYYPIEEFGFAYNSPNGFVLSSACETAYFLGGSNMPYWASQSRKSIAERMLLLENAGAVGVSMNYDVGYYSSDPPHDIRILTHLKNAFLANSKARVGDGLITLNQSLFASYSASHQALNRFWFGDPASRIGQRPCHGGICPDQEPGY